jgi:hypothetical protein
MAKNKLIPLLVLGAMAVVSVLGFATYRTVQAQSPTPTVPPAGMHMGFKGGASDQDLATALGITVDKLQAAYKAANTEALKQAVSKGLITQAQADQLAARQGFPGRVGFGRGFNSSEIDYDAILANSLGITVDTLKAGYQQAFTTSIDNALKAGTITQQQADLAKGKYALSTSSKFLAALQSAYEAAIKQAVTDGLITQSQADQILAQKSGTAGPGMMRGFGGFGDFGSPGRHSKSGRFGGQGTAPSAPSAPSAPAAPTATPSTSNGL